MALKASRREALDFLRENPVGTIATINKDSQPQLAVVYFVVTPNLNCYVVTKKKTRKFKNIQGNDSGTILSFNEEELTCAELSGELEEVQDSVTKVRVIERFQTVVDNRPTTNRKAPLAQIKAGQDTVIRLKTKQVRFRKFTQNGSESTAPTEHVFKAN